MTQEIKCPMCETIDPEVVSIQEEVVRVTRSVGFSEYQFSTQTITNHWVGNELDSEVVDTYDDESFRCEDCGFITDDPDEFIHDTEDNEEW